MAFDPEKLIFLGVNSNCSKLIPNVECKVCQDEFWHEFLRTMAPSLVNQFKIFRISSDFQVSILIPGIQNIHLVQCMMDFRKDGFKEGGEGGSNY